MSEPPPASSWAEPPEFYLDENLAGRTVRRFITELGYRVHTGASVFSKAVLDKSLSDNDWLPIAGRKGWVVICRDQHILLRDGELKAYLDAKVHLFLLPGDIARAQIIELLQVNLREMCTLAAARIPNVYWLTRHGIETYEHKSSCRRRSNTRKNPVPRQRERVSPSQRSARSRKSG